MDREAKPVTVEILGRAFLLRGSLSPEALHALATASAWNVTLRLFGGENLYVEVHSRDNTATPAAPPNLVTVSSVPNGVTVLTPENTTGIGSGPNTAALI